MLGQRSKVGFLRYFTNTTLVKTKNFNSYAFLLSFTVILSSFLHKYVYQPFSCFAYHPHDDNCIGVRQKTVVNATTTTTTAAAIAIIIKVDFFSFFFSIQQQLQKTIEEENS